MVLDLVLLNVDILHLKHTRIEEVLSQLMHLKLYRHLLFGVEAFIVFRLLVGAEVGMLRKYLRYKQLVVQESPHLIVILASAFKLASGNSEGKADLASF